MDQDSLIVHRGLALRPQVDRDTPIVHERPHAHWTMQARAEVASLIVATSVLVGARPPSALSASEHVPLLVCQHLQKDESKKEQQPLLLHGSSCKRSHMPMHSHMPKATQNQIPL